MSSDTCTPINLKGYKYNIEFIEILNSQNYDTIELFIDYYKLNSSRTKYEFLSKNLIVKYLPKLKSAKLADIHELLLSKIKNFSINRNCPKCRFNWLSVTPPRRDFILNNQNIFLDLKCSNCNHSSFRTCQCIYCCHERLLGKQNLTEEKRLINQEKIVAKRLDNLKIIEEKKLTSQNILKLIYPHFLGVIELIDSNQNATLQDNMPPINFSDCLNAKKIISAITFKSLMPISNTIKTFIENRIVTLKPVSFCYLPPPRHHF